jgi:hypothetical protein
MASATLKGSPYTTVKGSSYTTVKGSPYTTLKGSPYTTLKGSPYTTLKGSPYTTLKGSPTPPWRCCGRRRARAAGASALKSVAGASEAAITAPPIAAAGMAVALASGASAGWLLTQRRGAAAAFGVATITMTLASGGPLPVAQSMRGLWLSLALVPIVLAAGVLVSALHAWVSPLESS